jgi:NAD(P)-dependent dehydrogenase (short-subunit alcohol dehydrogenase family)
MSEERVAVVTGAAQGIGRRTAEVLAEEGYLLAVVDAWSGSIAAKHH